ncbi:hypothetical protein, partial [Ferrimicrobium sp.]|uniref:DUF7507 domain-containing protein n=1 Tax=Ferrimicrobium sp. TaxID=2926050 RepID=UPI002618AA89
MQRKFGLGTRVLGGLVLALGSTAIAAVGTSSSSLASNNTPVYTPVAFNVASLINGGVLSSTVHLEQTVQAANGNYYVDTDGGNGVTSTNEIIDVSGSAPHAAVGIIQLPSSLAGVALGDGVAIGDTLYYRNVNGANPVGGTGACPVIAVNLAGLPTATDSTTTPSYSVWTLTSSSAALTCPPVPSSGAFITGNEVYPIASLGSTVYWLGKSSLFAWNTTTDTVTRLVTGLSPGGGLSVNAIGGSVYAFVGTSGSAIDLYNLGGNGSTAAATPTYSWTLAASGGWGDFQLSQSGTRLWFVREFHTQIGYVPIPGDLPNPATTSGTGRVYTINNVPGGASQAESMTLDPTTGNLWVASGNVNGKASTGGEVDFGWFNPSTFSGSGTSSGASVGSVALNYESTPQSLSLGADDFVLVGSSPAYFSLGPILSITKTDNVNHVTTSGAPFDWTITAGLSSESASDEPYFSETAGTLEQTNNPSGFPITVTDPLPAGITPTGPATGTDWTCNQSGGITGPYLETCVYYLTEGTGLLTPGTALPPITVPVVGVGAPGTQFDNTATVSSPDATPQSASDIVTVVASPVTAPLSTPGLSLTKTEAPGSPNPITTVGQSVTYDFVVTDTGNTALNNLSVTDNQSVTGESLAGPISCPATSLAAGASVTCTGTYTVTST